MNLLQFLAHHRINFTRIDHEPLYTCEQANEVLPNLAGAPVKNLLAKHRKTGDFYLIIVMDDKRIDWSALAKQLGGRLELASPQTLAEVLQVEPGAVSVLALYNDTAHRVTLLIDEDVWQEEAMHCSPLVNTATLVINKPDIERFLALTEHEPVVMKIAAQSESESKSSPSIFSPCKNIR